MSLDESAKQKATPPGIELSDDDIYEAMKDIQGYLDVTPADLKEIYRHAYQHAVQRIIGAVKARNIMTRKVFSVKRSTPVTEVAAIMARQSVSGVPVVDEDGRVAGVISEKDFLSRMSGDKTHFMAIVAECLQGRGCLAMPIRSQKAEDIMTSPAVTVGEDISAVAISDIFTEKTINRVPVVDGEGHLTGIVSRSDIVRASLMHGRTPREEG